MSTRVKRSIIVSLLLFVPLLAAFTVLRAQFGCGGGTTPATVTRADVVIDVPP